MWSEGAFRQRVYTAKAKAFPLPGKRESADRRVRGKAEQYRGPTREGRQGLKRKSESEVGVGTVLAPAIGPNHGLFVKGSIRSVEFQILIDTGATDTLIGMTVYHQLPREQRPTLEDCDTGVRQVDGSPLKVYGAAWLDLRIGKTVHPIKAIFADIGVPAMLGMDWLLSTEGSLDFKRLELCVNGERIKCTSAAGEPFVGRVVVTTTKEIPAGHETIVPGTDVS